MKYLGYLVAFVMGSVLTWLVAVNFTLVEVESDNENLDKSVIQNSDKDDKSTSKATTINNNPAHDIASDSQQLISSKEVEALQQQLVVMKKTNEQLSQRLNTIEQTSKSLDKEKFDAGDKPELYAKIPETHLKLLQPNENLPKTIDQLHEEVVEEEEDISWATLKEQQLSYYYTGHRYSNFIEINLIQCKSTLCEILGSEQPSDVNAWQIMNDELRKEAWADFSGNNTSSTSGQNGNKIFVTILRKSPHSELQKKAP